MTNKVTEKARFEALLNCAEACALYPDMVDWFAKKLGQIESRKVNKKPTEAQVQANDEVNAIFAYMNERYNQLFSIAELIKNCPACAGKSNQMVYSRLRSLMDDGKVERVQDKRKVYFKVIVD